MGNKTLVHIDETIGRLNTHPEYSDNVRLCFVHGLRTDADKHSYYIEEETSAPCSESQRAKERAIALNRLNSARNFLNETGINLYSLSRLGAIIDPEKNITGSLRVEDVTFGGFNPTPWGVLKEEIYHLASFLNDDTSVHPVNRAIEAQIEMVRLHPFMDGNGRAARTLQNFCLEQRGYAPALISVEERELYLGLMKEVLKSRYDKKSSKYHLLQPDELFYDFIQSKVLSSMTNLEYILKQRRVYDIHLEDVDGKDLLLNLKKIVRNTINKFHGNTNSVQVHGPHKKNNACLRVIGNLSKEELEGILGNSQFKKFGVPYSVVPGYNCKI